MTTITSFEALGVHAPLLRSLSELGYETPTPIQAESIPILIAGKDLQAQAQTGTGKTAAFALPVLLQIELSIVEPQALVVVPTRELAIQVAEAFQRYARHLPGFFCDFNLWWAGLSYSITCLTTRCSCDCGYTWPFDGSFASW